MDAVRVRTESAHAALTIKIIITRNPTDTASRATAIAERSPLTATIYISGTKTKNFAQASIADSFGLPVASNTTSKPSETPANAPKRASQCMRTAASFHFSPNTKWVNSSAIAETPNPAEKPRKATMLTTLYTVESNAGLSSFRSAMLGNKARRIGMTNSLENSVPISYATW